MSTPTAPTPDQCRCKVVGWTRDPAEPHMPRQPEWEQADDCPVHPPMTAPTPDADDEREALVEVAAEAIAEWRSGDFFQTTADEGDRIVARAVLDAVADRLVAPLKARLAEVEAERDEAIADHAAVAKAHVKILAEQERRAEADLAAARRALYAARDALYRGEGPDMFQDADIVYGEWLGNRADRLATQATNDEEA